MAKKNIYGLTQDQMKRSREMIKKPSKPVMTKEQVKSEKKTISDRLKKKK